ncbi:hypothetical protein [Bradyrhizobium sp. RDM4]|uniref:hypothetical protein n=1 Tax=Bradyrhizobium sp. RDM4 TaxID=3378765 RepID=UPI0038FCC813
MYWMREGGCLFARNAAGESFGAVSLRTAEGIMLARSRDDDGAYVGRDMSGSPLFRTM